MRPFATVDDLAAGWRQLTEEEAGCAAVLLGRASAQIAAAMRAAGADPDPSDAERAEAMRMVACSMTRRAMSVADDMVGVSQYSQTAGVYSATATLASTSADMWLTDSEREALGIGSWRGAASLRPRIGGRYARA